LTTFEWVAVAVVAVTSAARITRLVTWDKYPPSMWFRNLWRKVTKDGDWSILVECGYCFGVWAAGGVVLWGYLVDFDTAWFLFNGWMGASYLAAIMVAFDGDDG
jgi:hypothetical protein